MSEYILTAQRTQKASFWLLLTCSLSTHHCVGSHPRKKAVFADSSEADDFRTVRQMFFLTGHYLILGLQRIKKLTVWIVSRIGSFFGSEKKEKKDKTNKHKFGLFVY